MESYDAALDAWEKWLLGAEEDLRERERQAFAADASPLELLALAAEHDKIALHRDAIASSYDDLVVDRDSAGLDRDVAGSARDRRARSVEQDLDAGFPDRSLAAADRDYSAGDRSDSHDDRRRSRRARERAAADRTRAADDRERAVDQERAQDRRLDGLRVALESRLVIGQAQGLLMARHSTSSDKAFAVLVRLSQQSNVKLRDLAAQLVAAADADIESHR